MQDPVNFNELHSYLNAVSEQLASLPLPLPDQSNAHALRVAELAGAVSAHASGLSASLAALDRELDALESDLAEQQAERERLAAERAG